MSSPPRTPLVPAPKRTTSNSQMPHLSPLKAPIVIVAGGKEWEHERGNLTIGRDADAGIVLTDPLVSGLHARFVVAANGQVVIEDLHSSNGVFVNGTKLLRPMSPLFEGDRLLLGTTEISVFSLRASATVPLDRQQDPSAPESSTMRSPPSPEAPPLPEIGALGLRRKRTVCTTGRRDAVDLVGHLAEQLVTSGHPLEAERILSEHLHNLLRGASAGLAVPPNILQSATRHAMNLFQMTQRDSWIGYVLELHLTCQAVPSEESLTLLESAARPSVDRSLVRYLVTAIENRTEPQTYEESLRLQRLERLTS